MYRQNCKISCFHDVFSNRNNINYKDNSFINNYEEEPSKNAIGKYCLRQSLRSGFYTRLKLLFRRQRPHNETIKSMRKLFKVKSISCREPPCEGDRRGE